MALDVRMIGDAFVRAELMETAVRRALGPLMDELDVRLTTTEVDWPATPLVSSAEVQEFCGDEAEVAAFAAGADLFVTHVAPVTERVLEAAPGLRAVGCCRGGLVNVNVAAATARGIPVLYAPGRNVQSVVEFTLSLMLAAGRGLAQAHCALARGEWRGDLYTYDTAGRDLQGQTVGLVGFGAVARALLPYLHPFGVRLLAFDPFVPVAEMAALGVEKRDALHDLLAEADVVSLHARVTPQTVGMMGAAEFAAMKPGSYFVNTARGPLVDYDALYDALVCGPLGGAALDCFEPEPPPPDWPLLRLPNVTLSPHMAGNSASSAERSAALVAEDLAALLRGEPLRRCINAAALGR